MNDIIYSLSVQPRVIRRRAAEGWHVTAPGRQRAPEDELLANPGC